jgi:hypothetical protein
LRRFLGPNEEQGGSADDPVKKNAVVAAAVVVLSLVTGWIIGLEIVGR